ncbi:MAG: hypothetical protein RBT71_10785 [Flavobacteriales bacterium]|nr:hypothetical protein [Flavobacteriales bacterium]
MTIVRPSAPLRATIDLPRSKSISNRALIIASLLGDPGLVQELSDGDDTRVMRDLLRSRAQRMDCGAGGTTFRFLLAWAAVQEGEERLLTGIPRLLQRPHDDLVDALRTLGADITRTTEGFRVRGRRMPGGTAHFDSPISSQYLSALLLIAPRLEKGLTLRWTGTRLSEPFVAMTLGMLAHFGVYPALGMDGVRVEPGAYRPVPFMVPPDWSSAAFWYQQVALGPGSEVFLRGLGNDTLQGDREAVRLWEPWVVSTITAEGVRIAHRPEPLPWPEGPIDLKHVPDLFQPLAFTLAARGTSAVLTGLDNLVVKETDRLKAVAGVLHRLGATAQHAGGTFRMQGRITAEQALALDPDIDHRMALAAAPLAWVLPAVTVHDPGVVDKSYPAYWAHLRQAGYTVRAA